MTKIKGTFKPLFSRKNLTRELTLYQLMAPGDKTNAEVAV